MNSLFETDLSVESIKQQKPDFFKALIAVYDRYRDLRLAELLRSDLDKSVSECIQHFTRANITFTYDEDSGPDAEFSISFFNPTHPLTPNLIRNRQSRLLNLHFDLTNARILGDTKEIVGVGFIPVAQVMNRAISSAMLAAGTLHEFGHYYIELMTLGSIARVNPAIERVAKNFDNNPDYQYRRSLIVREFKDSSLTPEALDRIARADDKVMVVTQAITETRDNLVHLLGADVYDKTISEAVADEFAVRHGAGQALAQYADYLNRRNNARNERLNARLGYYVRVTAGFLSLGTLAVTGSIAAAGVVLGAMVLVFTSVWTKPTEEEYLYDRDRDRLIRIRNQMQLRMRTTVKTSNQYKALKMELDAVDDLIKNTAANNDNFNAILTRIFNPTARRRLEQAKTEHLFEALAYNPLFDAALKLKYSK